MFFNINTMESKQIYKIMSQTIIPRPIAWVVTKDEVINIAPFSYFIGLSSNPATVLLSVGHKNNTTPKDTLANIRKTKKCVICMVEEKDLQKMILSSETLDKEISEADKFNIETKEIFKDYPPIIKNTPCAYFCSLNQEIDLGGKTVPLILNIEQIFIENDFVDKDLNIELDLVARVGKEYAKLVKIND